MPDNGEQTRGSLHFDREVERTCEVDGREPLHEEIEDADGEDPEAAYVVVDVRRADGAAADLAEVDALDEAGDDPGGRHGAQHVPVEEGQCYL